MTAAVETKASAQAKREAELVAAADKGPRAFYAAAGWSKLGAIVGGTETATEGILSAAEFIDQAANTLSAAVKSEHDKALAHDIQDHVVQIFEACNFQDLTGQRITKVVGTLKFIETHIVRMMEIWGGIESFKDIAPTEMAAREGDPRLVNGPRLDGDLGHASQDEIDALFN